MKNNVFVELSDIQAALSHGISMIAVIADGITTFTHHSAMTGKRAENYAVAAQSAYDMLHDANEKFEAILGNVDPDERENIA